VSAGGRGDDAGTSVDWSIVRYGQVWEDADVLRAGLDVRPGDRCLSIASAGDNALALLLDDPAEVVAIDRNPAQLACLGLRQAAIRCLEHEELLRLVGSRPGDDRRVLYERCRREGGLEPEHAAFWDARAGAIERGIGAAGRFDRYFERFRRFVLPLIHRRRMVDALLEARSRDERAAFHDERWDGWRWRLLFRLFFSRWTMGRLGRDPALFRYVEGPVAERLLERARHALVELDPSANPYLHWIVRGRHGAALPAWLQPEQFETLRSRIDRLTPVLGDLGEALPELRRTGPPFARFNLSDVFEYLSPEASSDLLSTCCDAGEPGGRLLYWNMLALRSRPPALAERLEPMVDRAAALHVTDRAFFYRRLVIEEILG